MNRASHVSFTMIVFALLAMPGWILAETSGGSGNTTSKSKPNQSKSVQDQATDMIDRQGSIAEKYDVVPVRQGELVDDKGHALDQIVKNKKGESLGTIEKLLKDKKTGRIEYAVLELDGTKHRLPLQWTLIKQEKGKLVLNASRDELEPKTSPLYTKDLSPDISRYMDEINELRSHPKPIRSPQTEGNVGEPASTGPMGESAVGGGGPSGTSPVPPGGAPGYEGDHPSSKR